MRDDNAPYFRFAGRVTSSILISVGVRAMGKSSDSSRDKKKPVDVSNVVKLASDRLAVEKACRRIDNYIAERWQPTSPDGPEAA
jgi:hypothetical protein